MDYSPDPGLMDVDHDLNLGFLGHGVDQIKPASMSVRTSTKSFSDSNEV